MSILRIIIEDQERYFVPGTVQHVAIAARGETGEIWMANDDAMIPASRAECLVVAEWLKNLEASRDK